MKDPGEVRNSFMAEVGEMFNTLMEEIKSSKKGDQRRDKKNKEHDGTKRGRI